MWKCKKELISENFISFCAWPTELMLINWTCHMCQFNLHRSHSRQIAWCHVQFHQLCWVHVIFFKRSFLKYYDCHYNNLMFFKSAVHWFQQNTMFVSTIRLLTQPRRATHTYIIKLDIVGSENSLLPIRNWALILTKDGLSLTGHFRTNFSKIWIKIQQLSYKKKTI